MMGNYYERAATINAKAQNVSMARGEQDHTWEELEVTCGRDVAGGKIWVDIKKNNHENEEVHREKE